MLHIPFGFLAVGILIVGLLVMLAEHRTTGALRIYGQGLASWFFGISALLLLAALAAEIFGRHAN